MKTIYLLLAIVLSLGVSAESVRDTLRVKGKGVGETKATALKDAYRDAVERAVGLFVDSEQLVRDDQLVQDQVLTASNAYIEKYECLKTINKGDLILVEILATVRRGELTKRLNEVMPTQRVNLSKDSSDVHARIVTEMQMTGDAIALLQNELKEMHPLSQLMKVTLASTKPMIENVDGESDMVRLWYPMSVSVDAERYYKFFAPRMDKILNQIKVSGPDRLTLRNIPELSQAYERTLMEKFGKSRVGIKGVMTRSDERLLNGDSSPLLKYGLALNEEYVGVRFLEGSVSGEKLLFSGIDDWWSRHSFGYDVCKKLYGDGCEYDNRYKRVWREFLRESAGCYTVGCRHKPLPEGGAYLVAIVLESKGRNSTLSGKVYRISYECASAISLWQDRICMGKGDRIGAEHDSTAPTVGYVVSFKNDQGDEVAAATFDLMSSYLSNIACVTLKAPNEYGKGEEKGGLQMSVISPLVGGFSNGFTKWISVTLPKDDVLKIVSVDIKPE